MIEMVSLLDRDQFKLLGQTLKVDSTATDAIAKAAFALTGTLPLDTACMLMRYGELIGGRRFSAFTHLLPRIIEPAHSLSDLAQQFFARDAQAFFNLWATVGDLYAPIFWVTFFSEQLWQAHGAHEALTQGNLMKAKKIGWRLPFQFLRGSWKKYSSRELANTHQMLYEIDFGIKSGSLMPSLELFFTRHFTQEFKA